MGVTVINGAMNGLSDVKPYLSYMVAPPVPNIPTISNLAATSVDLNWVLPLHNWDTLTVTGYNITATPLDEITNLPDITKPAVTIVVGKTLFTTGKNGCISLWVYVLFYYYFSMNERLITHIHPLTHTYTLYISLSSLSSISFFLSLSLAHTHYSKVSDS